MAAGDFEKALTRPRNFFDLSPQEQWDIDKRLGILDWVGDCAHNPHKPCKKCEKKFNAHFRLFKKAAKK